MIAIVRLKENCIKAPDISHTYCRIRRQGQNAFWPQRLSYGNEVLFYVGNYHCGSIGSPDEYTGGFQFRGNKADK